MEYFVSALAYLSAQISEIFYFVSFTFLNEDIVKLLFRTEIVKDRLQETINGVREGPVNDFPANKKDNVSHYTGLFERKTRC